MSDIIDLLERLGQNAQLRHATQAEIQKELQDANVSSDVYAALMGEDSTTCCLIYMPKEIPDEEGSPGKVNEPVPNEEELVPA
jgi:hypothetical protein